MFVIGDIFFVVCEGEYGEWYGNRNIYFDLIGFDVVLEVCGWVIVVGEDGYVVVVFVCVGEVNGFVKSVDVDYYEYGIEDFGFVVFYVGCCVVDDGRFNFLKICC